MAGKRKRGSTIWEDIKRRWAGKNIRYRKKTIPRGLKGYARIGGNYGRYNRKTSSELKFFDIGTTAYTVDTTPEVIPWTVTSATSTTSTGSLVQIVQGDTESMRNGRKITIKSIQCKGFLTGPTTTPNDVIQLYLILDKQCNGALPSYSDVFEDVPVVSEVNRMINLSNSSRFTIIKKLRMTFVGQTALAGPVYTSQIKSIDFYKKCNIPIEYDSSATTGVVTSVKSNNLFWLAVGSASDDGPILSLNNRLRFVDN